MSNNAKNDQKLAEKEEEHERDIAKDKKQKSAEFEDGDCEKNQNSEYVS